MESLLLPTSVAQVFSCHNEVIKSLLQLQRTFGIPSVHVLLSHFWFLQTAVLQLNWWRMCQGQWKEGFVSHDQGLSDEQQEYCNTGPRNSILYHSPRLIINKSFSNRHFCWPLKILTRCFGSMGNGNYRRSFGNQYALSRSQHCN